MPGQMEFRSVLIDGRSRLSAPVALRAVKVKGGNGVLAVNTFERDAAVEWVGCVVTHNSL